MTEAAVQSSSRRWELLGNRNFILLWCAYGISAMGDHLSEMAILKTQNAASADVDVTPLIARMTFLFFVPFFLLSPVTGWLADRLPRRGLMITADLVRCVIMLWFMVMMGWTASWSSWGPFIPLLVVGVFAAMFSPARSALLPTLIRPDQLVRANGMISGLGVIATMVAVFLGGYLIDRYGKPEYVFRLDAATFFASAFLLWLLQAPPQRARSAGDHSAGEALGEVKAGFQYVRCHHRVIELLGIASLVWFCGPLVNCVIPAVVRDVYGYAENYRAMSLYRGLFGVGFILGAVTVTTFGNALRSEIAITWGLLGISISMAVFAGSVFLPLAFFTKAVIGAVGVILAGMFGVVVLVSFNALLQRIVADRYRGRVFGIRDLCCTASLLLATGLLGAPGWARLDDWVGWILAGVGFATLVAWFVNLRTRLKRSRFPWALAFCENANEFIAKFWWRVHRVGRCTVPLEGPVILTSNHTCSADPLFLHATSLHRPTSMMVAAEYTKNPLLWAIMSLVDSIPVRRGENDTGATKQAIRHLRAGKAMGIFIEGRTVPPGENVQPMDGVAMLALRTGAQVIPAHISGVKYRRSVGRGLLARHNARVRYGPPVDLSEFQHGKVDRAAIRAATWKIYRAIQDLAPPDYSWSRPDRQPD